MITVFMSKQQLLAGTPQPIVNNCSWGGTVVAVWNGLSQTKSPHRPRPHYIVNIPVLLILNLIQAGKILYLFTKMMKSGMSQI